jgi:DNA-binding CsgD family transcriptional regulator
MTMHNASTVPVNDAILVLAFIGDLSMGRLTDHSLRTARLAARLAAAADGQRPRLPPKAAIALTDRETDVLRQISLGMSNKEVARILTISPSTVRTHVESVFRKLECSTRAAAALKAFTQGLL